MALEVVLLMLEAGGWSWLELELELQYGFGLVELGYHMQVSRLGDACSTRPESCVNVCISCCSILAHVCFMSGVASIDLIWLVEWAVCQWYTCGLIWQTCGHAGVYCRNC